MPSLFCRVCAPTTVTTLTTTTGSTVTETTATRTSKTATTVTMTTHTDTTTTQTDTTVTTTTQAKCDSGTFRDKRTNDCTDCPAGTFMARTAHSFTECLQQSECSESEHVLTEATATANVVCGRSEPCSDDVRPFHRHSALPFNQSSRVPWCGVGRHLCSTTYSISVLSLALSLSLSLPLSLSRALSLIGSQYAATCVLPTVRVAIPDTRMMTSSGVRV